MNLESATFSNLICFLVAFCVRDAFFLFLNLSALFSTPAIPPKAWWASSLFILIFIAYIAAALFLDRHTSNIEKGEQDSDDSFFCIREESSALDQLEYAPSEGPRRATTPFRIGGEGADPPRFKRQDTDSIRGLNARSSLALAQVDLETRAVKRLLTKVVEEPRLVISDLYCWG